MHALTSAIGSIIGALFFLGGIVVVMLAVANGTGSSRILGIVAGIASALLGLLVVYLANDKSWSEVLSRLTNGL